MPGFSWRLAFDHRKSFRVFWMLLLSLILTITESRIFHATDLIVLIGTLFISVSIIYGE